MTHRPLILLGLNELNFDMVRAYAEGGGLPNFKILFDTYPVIETTSEKKYEELEPWIQWVSVQTGKTFAEHKVFRLGDVTHADMTQIWEHLEKKYGTKVAAISPMNAANRCADPAFFVPDPWTKTTVQGGWLVRKLAGAVANAVNENATGGSRLSSYIYILLGVLRYSLFRNPKIIPLTLKALGTRFRRAIVLDQVLVDVFTSLWQTSRPGFSSLFLNSCAHIQHHYMFNSVHYDGPNKNPDWYMRAGEDPVYEGYKNYDDILGRLMKLPDSPRFLIATGLHQVPVEQPVFYWRLKDHSAFLNSVGIRHKAVQPRMSRDFLVEFDNERDAGAAEKTLKSCKAADGTAIFEEIENRKTSIFVTLTYPHDIMDGFEMAYDAGTVTDLKPHVGFVAIKNGKHDGLGYLVDTAEKIPAGGRMPVTDLFAWIDAHFSADEKAVPRRAA